MKTLILAISFLLTGCASQQLAQTHWNWLTQNNSGAQASYSSGVNITPISVNGQSFQVITPAR